jgi:hypothetical protein
MKDEKLKYKAETKNYAAKLPKPNRPKPKFVAQKLFSET